MEHVVIFVCVYKCSCKQCYVTVILVIFTNLFIKSNIFSLRVSSPPLPFAPMKNLGAFLITVTQIYMQISHDHPTQAHPSTQARYKSDNVQVEHRNLSSWIVLPERGFSQNTSNGALTAPVKRIAKSLLI